tara:strand:- start:3623 stop:5233 length:1611 start_codon:yes stop_codon:yes gene_type:complete
MSIESALEKLNIQASTLHVNLSYDELLKHETSASGFEKGIVTQSGAVAVDTGAFTGRSAKDKYIVYDETTKDTIWWKAEGSDNQPLLAESWDALKTLSTDQLNGNPLYIMDGFCGANPNTRLAVRLVTEVAWMAHFFKNMFIAPTEAETASFTPDWTILNACKTKCDNYDELGIRSETYIAFNIQARQTIIGNTWYGGEIKKGMFSIMNYFLPLQEIAALHCSANQGLNGDTALFFGLSGTGKTTLSASPNRKLIGDDEHGWDADGIFNFEGGCYAKTIDLSEEKEPDIYRAIRPNALLENVVVNTNGVVDFTDGSKTENTRVSYPIQHIDNIVTPRSVGNHPEIIIFLTCDAYGVLPPVSKLTTEQAMYQYLSGYTAKIPGTELGVTKPTSTFSTCFGKPFLTLHPTAYAKTLGDKINAHNSRTYLVNTGWTGGAFGVGHRISLHNTRNIINSILDGSIETAPTELFGVFNFSIPTELTNVDSHILNPANTWSDPQAFASQCEHLAKQFVENFKKYERFSIAKSLTQAGPVLATA